MTFCDSPTGIGVSLRTDGRRDGRKDRQTDFYVEIVFYIGFRVLLVAFSHGFF